MYLFISVNFALLFLIWWPRCSAHVYVWLPSLYDQESHKLALTCKDRRALKSIPAHSILQHEFRVTGVPFWMLEGKADICLKYIVSSDTAARLIKQLWIQKAQKRGRVFQSARNPTAPDMTTLKATFYLSSWKSGCSPCCLKESWERA